MTKLKLSEKITPIYPHRMKPQEENRINPVYFNLSDGEFTPIEDVNYLWVLTAKKELIIGVEKLWEHPEVCVDPDDLVAVAKFNSLFPPESQLPLGHPTLASCFDDGGEAIKGSAFIGGEITLINGKLHINNKSGRYGKLTGSSYQIQKIMHNVADIFKEKLKIEIIVDIKLAHALYLHDYYNIWNLAMDEVSGTLKLLEKYSPSEYANFIALHSSFKDFSFFLRDKNELTMDRILIYFKRIAIYDETVEQILRFIAGATNRSMINIDSEQISLAL